MAARLSKSGENASSDQVGVPGGGSASKDYLYDIFQRLSSIENSLTFITASVDDSKTRLDSLSKDVAEAKAKFETLSGVVSWASKGIWAIGTLLLTFGLTVLGMWLKHKQGW